MAKDKETTFKDAIHAAGMTSHDKSVVHGFFEVQFGKYAGQFFRWTLENDLGYSAAMAYSFGKDVENQSALSRNKACFRRYVLSFAEGKEAVAIKMKEKAAGPTPRSSLSSMMVGSQPSTQKAMAAKLHRLTVTQKATPNLQGKKWVYSDTSDYQQHIIFVSF